MKAESASEFTTVKSVSRVDRSKQSAYCGAVISIVGKSFFSSLGEEASFSSLQQCSGGQAGGNSWLKVPFVPTRIVVLPDTVSVCKLYWRATSVVAAVDLRTRPWIDGEYGLFLSGVSSESWMQQLLIHVGDSLHEGEEKFKRPILELQIGYTYGLFCVTSDLTRKTGLWLSQCTRLDSGDGQCRESHPNQKSHNARRVTVCPMCACRRTALISWTFCQACTGGGCFCGERNRKRRHKKVAGNEGGVVSVLGKDWLPRNRSQGWGGARVVSCCCCFDAERHTCAFTLKLEGHLAGWSRHQCRDHDVG